MTRRQRTSCRRISLDSEVTLLAHRKNCYLSQVGLLALMESLVRIRDSVRKEQLYCIIVLKE